MRALCRPNPASEAGRLTAANPIRPDLSNQTFFSFAESRDQANETQFAQELDWGLGDDNRGHQGQTLWDRECEWQDDERIPGTSADSDGPAGR